MLNVLRGEMRFVGLRPEVRPYVELFRENYEEILRVIPGITALASVKFRDEVEIFRRFENSEAAYVGYALPDKIKLAKDYVRRSSLFFDITLILNTFLKPLL